MKRRRLPTTSDPLAERYVSYEPPTVRGGSFLRISGRPRTAIRVEGDDPRLYRKLVGFRIIRAREEYR